MKKQKQALFIGEVIKMTEKTPEQKQKIAELIEHKNETIQNIRNKLDRIEKSKDIEFIVISDLNDMLCRVGELESTLIYVFDLIQNPDKAEAKQNRLCNCYDRQ